MMESNETNMAITGLGMVSSLGLDVATACAAARAGLALPTELDYTLLDRDAGEEVKVCGHAVGGYTKGFSELGRWVRLGSLALENLLGRARMEPQTLAQMPLFVNLPSGYYLGAAARRRAERQEGAQTDGGDEDAPPYDELTPWYEKGIIPKLFAALDVIGLPGSQKVFFEDEAGAVSALVAARDTLASGRVSRCVVGGIDSLVDPFWLAVCDEIGVLKTPLRPVGFMPGEAAAFLQLEMESTARLRGAPILATIGGLAARQDPRDRFSDKPPAGIALSEVILDSLRHAGGRCTLFHSDVNGDAVRAADWGSAQVRLQGHVDGATEVVPAMSFGATRAASGFVSTCLAVQSLAGRRNKAKTLLVWVASDSGARGSFLVNRSDGG